MKRFFLMLAPAILLLFLILLPFATTLAAPPTEFKNPIQSKDLAALIKCIVDQLFPFAITLTAVGILAYGFLYVVYLGSGNEGGIKKLKGLMLWLIIGAAIVAGSKVIVDAVVKFGQEISK